MGILSIAVTVVIGTLLMFPLACIQTFFYYKTIGLKQNNKRLHIALQMILFSVIMIALNINPTYIEFMLTLIWIILYSVLFMGNKLKERILFGILNCVIYILSGLFSFIIVAPESWVDLSKVSFPEIMLIIAISYIIYAILVLVIIHVNTDGRRYMSRKYWIGIMICFTAILIVLFVISNFDLWLGDTKKLQTYITIFTVVGFAIWLLLYFIFYFVCRYFSKATEANMLAVQNDMIERYLLQKQESDERISILSHDLKHSLVQWRKLAEEKGDINALQSISEYELQLLSSLLINVENESATAIINQKLLEAKQAQVEFSVEGVFHKNLSMNKADLCSLLGNMLDNAIEAAAQAKTETLRRVKLSIKRKENLLILVVENSYEIEPVVRNGTFITHKKDKHLHAIGMLSIKYVTEKYEGVVNYSYENKCFKASVILNGYPVAPSDEK